LIDTLLNLGYFVRVKVWPDERMKKVL